MSDWALNYTDLSPELEPLREALCALGNGYFVTRGAAAERPAGDSHYPGTYLAGGYDRLVSDVAGRAVENEDLVNWPDWLPLTFRPGDGCWLDPDAWSVLEHRYTLDLQRGVLVRRLRVRDPEGRVTAMRSRRLVHMAHAHLAAIEWEITPENWSGPMVIRSALDGRVTNAGVARYSELDGRHLVHRASGAVEGAIHIAVETVQSRIRMAQAARTKVFADGHELDVERRVIALDGYVAEELSLATGPGRTIRVEKTVAIFTSRDHAISEPTLAATTHAGRAPVFAELLRTHSLAWKRLWHRCNVTIAAAPDSEPGAEELPSSQAILRLHLFHLLQTVSPHSTELDAGVPARGWHGEAYRGHVFWDELFIFPLLDLRVPEITRALLMYRFRRLGEARQLAVEEGASGARYPWQSGSTGREETQRVHLNPRSGRWVPDGSRRQAHVNSAVAYNVWQYYQATGDHEFLSFYGAEMMLEIARYWASRAEWGDDDGRYHLRGVMGPDEFHEGYPGGEPAGVDDNAYTNVFAAWVLRCAERVLAILPERRRDELCDQLELTGDELARWREVARLLAVPFHDGIISQFAGYERLEELDWKAYRERYGDIHRMDRILEAEGDSANRYRLSKQADVLMLLYLFSVQELEELLGQMGYTLPADSITRMVDYYLDRTTHGSTLSAVVHAWVLARVGHGRSWPAFRQALMSDVADSQGGTTAEGIHLGAMAGTVDMVQRGYLGVSLHDDALWLDPKLPPELTEVRVALRYRGQWLDLLVTHEELRVTVRKGPAIATATPPRLGVGGRVEELPSGSERRWPLIPSHPVSRMATANAGAEEAGAVSGAAGEAADA